MFRRPIIALLTVAGAAGGITFWPISPVRESARRSAATLNLRQIGQAILIYASERGNKLPEAENIRDYAGELDACGSFET